eukprot:c4581_g1_i1.p1 GENE.c4581_g1_i1~~c4581_g1_i1.p1  ORF type:complete len:347 (+),score=70.03 c4581_g1_i1:46-1041(+)
MAERVASVGSHLQQSNDIFLFTLDNSKLTYDQRVQYERDGFIIIKGLLDDDSIKRYNDRFQEICRMAPKQIRELNFLVMRDIAVAKAKEAKEAKFQEDTITKLQDWQDDPVLFEFCQKPEILEYVQGFCGPNVKSIHTMLINKPPDVGLGTSRHPMHQDLHYFPMRPAHRIVCAWAAMEHVHRENGCLTVVPGTHREYPLLPHEYPKWEGGVNKLYHGIEVDQEIFDRRIHVEMEKGDVVFFHPLLFHGSGANRTTGFRKAISCHYASSNCYVISIKNTTQESLANEIIETHAKRVFGVEPDKITRDMRIKLFAQVWKNKARLVCGVEGSF